MRRSHREADNVMQDKDCTLARWQQLHGSQERELDALSEVILDDQIS
jgi:hypothetical protein